MAEQVGSQSRISNGTDAQDAGARGHRGQVIMEFFRFGLIVTGDGEAEFLPKLFRSIMAKRRIARFS